MDGEDNWVYLQCVKVRSKLRVRVTSGSYFRDANCMFPRDLRKDGARYRVRPWSISLVTTRGKYYYSVKRDIEVLSEVVSAADLHIYEDEGTVECAICLTEPKNTVGTTTCVAAVLAAVPSTVWCAKTRWRRMIKSGILLL